MTRTCRASFVAAEPLERRTLLSYSATQITIPGTSSSNLMSIDGAGTISQSVIFAASNATTATQPWVSNGTAAGTKLLATINASGSSTPQNFTQGPSGTVFFTANNGSTTQIWRTDGTSAGTFAITNIANTSTTRGVDDMVYSPDTSTVYFLENEDLSSNYTTQYGLWKVSASATGPGTETQVAGPFEAADFYDVTLNGGVFFSAIDPTYGEQLYQSYVGGSSTGIVQVINSGDSGGTQLETDQGIVDGKDFYFIASTDSAGFQLWKSDGTSVGTGPLTNYNPGEGAGFGPQVSNMVAVGGWVYFVGFSSTDNYQIFAVNETTGQLLQFTHLHGTSASDSINDLTDVNGTIYLTYSASGEAALVSTLNGNGSLNSVPLAAGDAGDGASELTDVNGIVFFVSQTTTLFETDGTSMAAVGGTPGSSPSELTDADGSLYYSAQSAGAGQQLFVVPNVGPQTPTLTASIGGNQTVHVEDDVKFTATLSGGTIDSVKWDLTGSGDFNKTGLSQTATYNSATPAGEPVIVRAKITTTTGKIVVAHCDVTVLAGKFHLALTIPQQVAEQELVDYRIKVYYESTGNESAGRSHISIDFGDGTPVVNATTDSNGIYTGSHLFGSAGAYLVAAKATDAAHTTVGETYPVVAGNYDPLTANFGLSTKDTSLEVKPSAGDLLLFYLDLVGADPSLIKKLKEKIAPSTRVIIDMPPMAATVALRDAATTGGVSEMAVKAATAMPVQIEITSAVQNPITINMGGEDVNFIAGSGATTVECGSGTETIHGGSGVLTVIDTTSNVTVIPGSGQVEYVS
jgi:ELWxxDGT repeat protein